MEHHQVDDTHSIQYAIVRTYTLLISTFFFSSSEAAAPLFTTTIDPSWLLHSQVKCDITRKSPIATESASLRCNQ